MSDSFPKTVRTSGDIIQQLSVAIPPCLDDAKTRQTMIDADNLHLCLRHIVGLMRDKNKNSPLSQENINHLAVKKRWQVAIKTSKAFDVLGQDQWLVNNDLNLSARLDTYIRISGDAVPVMAYWYDPKEAQEKVKDWVIKKKHVASISAITHMLDADYGIIIYDNFIEHKFFQVVRTKRISEALVEKCHKIMAYMLSGEIPPPCKSPSGVECPYNCPYKEPPKKCP